MRTRSALIVLALLCTTLSPSGVAAFPAAEFTVRFATPMDAVSVRLEEGVENQAVSAWTGSAWTPWQELHVENEQDPALRESNLVMLPAGTTKLRFLLQIAENDVHPIRVSDAPVQYRVAAAGGIDHRILSRSDWGADDGILIAGKGPTATETIGDNGTTSSTTTSSGQASSSREQDCLEARGKYPTEFNMSNTIVTRNAAGQRYRWPQEYSPDVRLLVVHHTAISVAGDTRSGAERMRALYQYHADNRGWGDIGYHYVIDEKGQIYEGRAGGAYVVGGHVYCNNVGTIGVALMGNFDIEQPSQEQAKSLQWLLQFLGEKYHLNMDRNVLFHGKTLPPIVGHRQLISTDCPGTAMFAALDQVRMHVRTGDVDAAVTFPVIQGSGSSGSSSSSEPAIVTGKDGLASLGETLIEGRPGAEVSIPIFFRATKKAYPKNTRIGRITRTAGLTVWLDQDGKLTPARDLRTPSFVKKGESVVIRLRVKLPLERGSAALKVGLINYTFELSGRVARGRQIINGPGSMTLPENGSPSQQTRVTLSSSSSSSSSSSTMNYGSGIGPTIRVMLTGSNPLPCDSLSSHVTVNNGVTQIDSFFSSMRRYRGTISCQTIDGTPTLINTLSLEDYMAGLGEEPDTELYEKQRAFAIAARTYALYYMDSANRKFPGKPYDGSDSPATFQLYRGYDFEGQNPNWVRAVRDTSNKVLTYRGEVIKPPYFSSDDGKTRAPLQAGWSNFPFAEIFFAKDDPWCAGKPLAGHGVGMSGCGAAGQASEGRTAEQILNYYYPGTTITTKN